MGYLAEKGYDIFISYAHDDNVTLTGERDRGWVSMFHTALEVRLKQVLGAKTVSIWRDDKLRGNDDFSNEILEQFNDVSLFIPILTPLYVASEWCMRELKAFDGARENGKGIDLENKSRVFKVVKTPLAVTDHPESIRGQLGYAFYDEHERMEFSLMAGSNRKADLFREKLEDLVIDIRDMMVRLGAPSSSTQGLPESFAAENGEVVTVYVANSTSDIKQERSEILRALIDRKYSVLPQQELRALPKEEVEGAIRADLAKCDISIHLIGSRYGHIPEGSRDSLEVMQSELAAQKGDGSGFSRLIWMPKDLEFEDERQEAFVRKLENDEGMLRGADFIQESLENLKSHILDRLVQMREVGDGDDEVTAERPLMLYLLSDVETDYRECSSLYHHLRNAGFEVTLPMASGTDEQRLRHHSRRLEESDGVLLFCGSSGEGWLWDKIDELEASSKTLGVFFAPPAEIFKDHFHRSNIAVIKGFSDIPTDELKQFARLMM